MIKLLFLTFLCKGLGSSGLSEGILSTALEESEFSDSEPKSPTTAGEQQTGLACTLTQDPQQGDNTHRGFSIRRLNIHCRIILRGVDLISSC